MLYSEADLENSMSKIDTVHFHQDMEVEGIKFWCYHGRFVLHNLYKFIYLNLLAFKNKRKKLVMC